MSQARRSLLQSVKNDAPKSVLEKIMQLKAVGKTAVLLEKNPVIKDYFGSYEENGLLYCAVERMRKSNNKEWLPVIEALLEAGVDPNENKTLCTITYDNFDHLELLRLFIKYHVNTTIKIWDYTLLHSFARDKNIESMKALLESKFTQSTIDNHSKDGTALHVAARANFNMGIKLLLEHRANLEIMNYEGDTPLFCASEPDTIKCLLLAGANDKHNGNTLVHLYARRNIDVTQCQSLAEDINKKNKDGDTPLLLARTVENFSKLIDNGADICAVNNNGENILHKMIDRVYYVDTRYCHLFDGLVERLLKLDPKLLKTLLETQDKDGKTPLHAACRLSVFDGQMASNTVSVITKLARLYQHVPGSSEFRNKQGYTALQNFISEVNQVRLNRGEEAFEKVKAMLNLGADVFSIIEYNGKKVDCAEFAKVLGSYHPFIPILEKHKRFILEKAPYTLLNHLKKPSEKGNSPVYKLVKASNRSLDPLKIMLKFLIKDEAKELKGSRLIIDSSKKFS